MKTFDNSSLSMLLELIVDIVMINIKMKLKAKERQRKTQRERECVCDKERESDTRSGGKRDHTRHHIASSYSHGGTFLDLEDSVDPTCRVDLQAKLEQLLLLL